jgi:ABC-type oligopeptide transport system substrate-binding subunit
MKKQNAKLTAISTVTLLVLSLFACSQKKQDDKKDETDKMEMADAKPVEPVQMKSFENVDPGVKTQINGFLKDYFAINQALIEDNQEGAKAAAKKLSEAVAKFDMSKLMGEQMDFYHTQLTKLTQSLKGINDSADIEETRLELVTLSEAVYSLTKAYHPESSELYYQFCPMAKNGEGANWLSSTKEIINPYMGQRMPHCGQTQETIN